MRLPQVFHPARPAPAAWNLAKTLVQTAAFWGFFLFLVPALLVRVEDQLGWAGSGDDGDAVRAALGAALFVVAGAVGLWSGATMAVQGQGTPVPMDCPRRLVVAGPYRYVRNPMALSGICQGVGVGLVLGSPLVIAYALAGAPFWDRLVRPAEEEDLEARFGEEYRAYRAAVRCWWPRLRPYSAPD